VKGRAVQRIAVSIRRPAAVAVAALVASAWASHPAAAHVQVSPAEAAPGDRVEVELLVPGERKAHTIEVALRIPDGVAPFSFERAPGWHRQLDKRADGSIEVVRWHGELARDGFVRFAFLATTPDREGEVTWKAIQRYDDGGEAAWIGPPDSERPAAVTRISAAAPAQDAGGEGGAARAAARTGGAAPAPADEPSDGAGSTLALVLGAAGLLLGAAALIVALRRGRPRAEAW
jgi:uncharacterized protein YcnI